jgi:thioredoxin 1
MITKKISLIILTLLLVVLNGNPNDKCGCGGARFYFPLTLMSGILGCKDVKTPDVTETAVPQTENKNANAVKNASPANVKVTFIELGSVNCIPCRMMKQVMARVEEKYGNQVKIIFYDVWTAEGRPYAEQYGIRAIPTQVFLDKDGKEYFRHAGFFPFNELEKVLKKEGVE